jgi:glycine/D-amino acid oxidase-like deaminating enzyme/thiamine kinase-like enzyme
MVIIGGGVVGCSVAYHLAQRGVSDVVLLERRRLTEGSTWHAAGLVGQLRSTAGLTQLMRTSVQTYQSLEAKTGYATGWRGVGSLRVASSAERWVEIRRLAEMARGFDLEVELLGPSEAQQLFPLLDLDGVHGASWVPSDGYADPSQLTQSLAAGARAAGVTIVQGCAVTAVHIGDGRIECDSVVNATGMWGAQTARFADVEVAVQAVEHQYVVTETAPGIGPDLPTLRDPDARFYLKPEAGALLIGGWEEGTRVPWTAVPADFGAELFAPDHDRFAGLAAGATRRVPAFGQLGIRTWVNGPIPFTPDAEPLIGTTAEYDNLYHCCGFSAGIAAGGGAGAAVANLILDGDPGLDLAALDVRRFGPADRPLPHLDAQVVDAYARYYALGTADASTHPDEPSSADAPSAQTLDTVAVLSGRPRDVAELPGGLTNRNYQVTTPTGRYFVRTWSGGGDLPIDREHEYRNSVIAAESGVGAPVLEYRPELQMLVLGFLDGSTWTNDSFQVDGNLERVAQACRALHSGAPFVNDFDMFEIQRNYLDIVNRNGFRLPPRYAEFAPHVDRMREALAVRDEGVVPCNNDLLAANFIDDGTRIWLIDYEYAGNNDPCFELGNIWSECHLDDGQLDTLVSAYYGRPLRNKIARARLLGLMAKYGWTLWASIQAATSPIDFDFWSWGMERYDAARAMFEHPDFDRQLDEVQRRD